MEYTVHAPHVDNVVLVDEVYMNPSERRIVPMRERELECLDRWYELDDTAIRYKRPHLSQFRAEHERLFERVDDRLLTLCGFPAIKELLVLLRHDMPDVIFDEPCQRRSVLCDERDRHRSHVGHVLGDVSR